MHDLVTPHWSIRRNSWLHFVNDCRNLHSTQVLLSPHRVGISQSLKSWGGKWPTREYQIYRLYFCILSNKKHIKGLKGHKSLLLTSLGRFMDPAGPLKLTVPYLIIFEPISGCVYHFYIVHYLAPLTILEHFFGHCGTHSGLKGPSWTFMDPQMDSKMDPARLIAGHPW